MLAYFSALCSTSALVNSVLKSSFAVSSLEFFFQRGLHRFDNGREIFFSTAAQAHNRIKGVPLFALHSTQLLTFLSVESLVS